MIQKSYIITLELIKSEIQSSKIKVAKAITYEHIKLYWNIGKIILEKQKEEGWGKSVVEMISSDLQKDYPESIGYSARNLWDMRRFYARYHKNEKLRQLVAEIPWGHNLLILSKIKDDKESEFYINSTITYGWSRNVLLNQIKANAYQRALSENKSHNFTEVLPEYLSEQAEEALKSEYNLEFLGLNKGVKEKEAVELKIGEFKPEYAGKLNYYLEILDEVEKLEIENPTIGILLCAEKDSLEVEYSLRVSKKPIGIAEYKLTKDLPSELKNYIPNNKILKNKLKELN